MEKVITTRQYYINALLLMPSHLLQKGVPITSPLFRRLWLTSLCEVFRQPRSISHTFHDPNVVSSKMAFIASSTPFLKLSPYLSATNHPNCSYLCPMDMWHVLSSKYLLPWIPEGQGAPEYWQLPQPIQLTTFPPP